MRHEPLQSEVRRCAVKALEGASGVASLFESAAESALAAAEKLPLVGVACGIIHDTYRAVKHAKDNRKSCEQFGETLRGLEAILLKAARLDKPAATVKGLERVGPGRYGAPRTSSTRIVYPRFLSKIS